MFHTSPVAELAVRSQSAHDIVTLSYFQDPPSLDVPNHVNDLTSLQPKFPNTLLPTRSKFNRLLRTGRADAFRKVAQHVHRVSAWLTCRAQIQRLAKVRHTPPNAIHFHGERVLEAADIARPDAP